MMQAEMEDTGKTISVNMYWDGFFIIDVQKNRRFATPTGVVKFIPGGVMVPYPRSLIIHLLRVDRADHHLDMDQV